MASPPALTKPIPSLPLHFALLLFPSFQALDVFGPLDALNTLKRQYPSLPLRLSILSSSLSPISTFPQPPNPNSNDAGITTPFEQCIVPTHTYTSPPPQPIHILFIPGGVGTRLNSPKEEGEGEGEPAGWEPLVSYLSSFLSSPSPSSLSHLKGIFTVCTGSILLARSKIHHSRGGGGEKKGTKGTLDGVRATTNKRGFSRAKEELGEVLWEPRARWVRTDLSLPLITNDESITIAAAGEAHGQVHTVKLWTTSGVSAGTDGMFALIAEEYGEPIAQYIADMLEYERRTDPNDDPFAVQL